MVICRQVGERRFRTVEELVGQAALAVRSCPFLVQVERVREIGESLIEFRLASEYFPTVNKKTAVFRRNPNSFVVIEYREIIFAHVVVDIGPAPIEK